MSEIFEGIVVANLMWLDSGSMALSGLAAMQLSSTALVMYKDVPRSEMVFSGEVAKFAADLSKQLDKSLLVRYDSRLGHRSAVLFEKGEEVARFGQDDELFVPLDDDGEPLVNTDPVRRSNFQPGEEYETIHNAIQLGLRRLGVDCWNELFQTITEQN